MNTDIVEVEDHLDPKDVRRIFQDACLCGVGVLTSLKVGSSVDVGGHTYTVSSFEGSCYILDPKDPGPPPLIWYPGQPRRVAPND